jgi:hypothetical protein
VREGESCSKGEAKGEQVSQMPVAAGAVTAMGMAMSTPWIYRGGGMPREHWVVEEKLRQHL